MMKLTYWMLAGAFAFCTTTALHAQERSASGAVDTQMTWAALSTQIQGNKIYAEGVNAKVTQTIKCAKKGMVFATTDSPGADEEGCLPTTASNMNTVTTNTENITSILGCNAMGKIYNPTTHQCQSIIMPSMITRISASGAPRPGGGGKDTSYALATCPKDTMLIACMGSRTPDFTDTCDESDCGLIGVGPINESTCKVSIDNRTGRGEKTIATAWATCLKMQ